MYPVHWFPNQKVEPWELSQDLPKRKEMFWELSITSTKRKNTPWELSQRLPE